MGAGFEKNAYGFRIKKCCASCTFKRLGRSTKKRRCVIFDKNVLPTDCCENWEMNKLMKRIHN